MSVRIPLRIAALIVAAATTVLLAADQGNCPVLSAGAETKTGANIVSYQNLGQVVVGRSDNGVVFLHAGGGACLSVLVPCTLGDVDGNGRINGLDIDDFVRVKLTGVGTPRELCAANITNAYFVTLLLTS